MSEDIHKEELALDIEWQKYCIKRSQLELKKLTQEVKEVNVYA